MGTATKRRMTVCVSFGFLACAPGWLAGCTDDAERARDAGQDAAVLDASAAPDADPDPITMPNLPRPDAGPAALDAGPIDAGRMDAGAVDAGAEDAGSDAAVRTHGLERRVDNTTCFLNGSPPREIVPIAQQPAFTELDASGARALVQAPAGRLALVERSGRVRAFDPDEDGADTDTLLDLRDDVRADGLRGVAFRPDGEALFASFVPVGDPLRLVLARFDVDEDGVADPDSLEPLLTLPLMDEVRAGGALAFLFDGTLAVAFGDAGDAAASSDPAQLAAKLLRLDVSDASGYAVPPDNPFVDDTLVADEIYALDLLAPTSCSVDRVTGDLWCADAGDDTHDHILYVTPGVSLSPVLSFTRGAGCGAVLGHVSRDATLPDIQGALVFGDGCGETLSALRFDGSLVLSDDVIATLPAALAGFGEDERGRMLAVDADGDVHALCRPDTAPPEFPATLSATGCLTDMAARTPAASLVPFEVRAPLWSDGAEKHRFLALPSGETIGFTEEGAWEFPVGTIFMKEFALDDDQDADTAELIMETRFLIKRSDMSWEGYSFMWDRERKDAFLLEGAEIGRYAMQAGAVDDGGESVHRHTFPDRAQCLLCHNRAAGRALGLQTGRMNTDHDYDGFVENQLQAMDHIGLFSEPLPDEPDDLPRFAEPADEGAELEDRARGWLYANCSHCHRPGGPTPVELDFRYETALADTKACGVAPSLPLPQLPDANIIDPGDADNSELFFRLSSREDNQMPPIATLIVEPVGVEVLRDWIDSLSACP